MRAYQETYIENLKQIKELSGFTGKIPQDARRFLVEQAEKKEQIRRIAAENTELLRRNLMPVLDDVASADEEEIAHLDDFAGHLLQGVRQLDLVLNYTVRNALVAYARKWGKRDMLIMELYHTGMALLYLQEIADEAEQRRYSWKMGLMFGEAASYIRRYDEISDPQTRGYIHRSMANLALSYRWTDREEAWQKIEAIRRSFQVLTDPSYQEKTPSLPWDLYLYKSHQERTTAMTLLRTGEKDAEVIREVMESAEFVWRRQMENSKNRGVRPNVRWILEYEMALYHCGVHTLPELLKKMEELFLDQARDDFTEAGIFGNVYIPALYGDYLSRDRSLMSGKKKVMSFMYRQMARYVRKMSNYELNGKLMRFLLEGMRAFIEYPDGIQMKDFLITLVVGRDPDVYAYLMMTGDIARLLAGRAIDQIPGSLVGVLSCQDEEDVRARREELLQFVFESGVLHDVGLLLLGGLVMQSGRSLLEEEEVLYQFHANAGARLLSSCGSTRLFAPTALGHHRHFDGRGGYPDSYVREDNPNQAVTDVVSIAAVLAELEGQEDAYGSVSLQAVHRAVQEILDGAGSRFAPQFAGLLPSMEEELSACLTGAKIRYYEEAFRIMRGEAPGI